MKNMQTKKQTNLHRIKIIEGHLKAIERMIERDEYCVNVLHQSMAVQKALKKLDAEIMENHLRHCVIEQAKEGKDKKIVDELLAIYGYK